MYRLLALILIAFVAACSQTLPYRHIDCTNSVDECLPSHEITPDYDLFFAEFDDQGWLNSRGERSKSDAITEIERFLALAQVKDESLFLFTYVHGWKHNAAKKDDNIQQLRDELIRISRQLKGVAKEANANPSITSAQKRVLNKRVVGIYLGWRGDSVALSSDLLKDVSFYERKAAAERVANGDIRNIIALIAGYESRRNFSLPSEHGPTASSPKICDVDGLAICTVTSIFVGHSFGGLILYEALEGNLLQLIQDSRLEPTREDRTHRQFGSTVVLINPAVEATRFRPLLNLAKQASLLRRYENPVLISITTTEDVATRRFFPWGRRLGTFAEIAEGPEEAQANLTTIGHMEPYVTHHLQFTRVPDSETVHLENDQCPGEKSDSEWPKCWTYFEPPNGYAKLNPATESGARLAIWNVRTDKSVMSSHSDLNRAELRGFITWLIDRKTRYPLLLQTEDAGSLLSKSVVPELGAIRK
jgi:hypothetical protein